MPRVGEEHKGNNLFEGTIQNWRPTSIQSVRIQMGERNYYSQFLKVQFQKPHILWPLWLPFIWAFQTGHEMRSLRRQLVHSIPFKFAYFIPTYFSHFRCEKHMPNLCGVNQKQLSDALLEIKRNAAISSGASPTAMAAKEQQMVNGVGHKFKVRLWNGLFWNWMEIFLFFCNSAYRKCEISSFLTCKLSQWIFRFFCNFKNFLDF